MDNIDFVEVRTCQSHEEASVIKNALEEQGIACSLENDHQGGFTGVLAIRVLVPHDQEHAAKTYLDQHHAE